MPPYAEPVSWVLYCLGFCTIFFLSETSFHSSESDAGSGAYHFGSFFGSTISTNLADGFSFLEASYLIYFDASFLGLATGYVGFGTSSIFGFVALTGSATGLIIFVVYS